MSCEACVKAYHETAGYGFTWRDATVVLFACEHHAQEIFDVLHHADTGPDTGRRDEPA